MHKATIQDVVQFLVGHGYRAFYADGAGEELTKIADRAVYDQAKVDGILNERACPNFMFLRADLSLETYLNPQGCGERR